MKKLVFILMLFLIIPQMIPQIQEEEEESIKMDALALHQQINCLIENQIRIEYSLRLMTDNQVILGERLEELGDMIDVIGDMIELIGDEVIK